MNKKIISVLAVAYFLTLGCQFSSFKVLESSPVGNVGQSIPQYVDYLGSIGGTTDSVGSCPTAGPTGTWCVGGRFASGVVDGVFNLPHGIAIDQGKDYFYVSDPYNHRIERFKLSTGAFDGALGATSSSTGTCRVSGANLGWCTGGRFVSGTGDGMFDQPKGIAIDPVGGFLYVADLGNSRVQKFALASGAFVGAIGLTTGSSGTCPSGVATNGWCKGGVFARGVGDGMFVPNDVAIDLSRGYLYVADGSPSRIQRIDLSSGQFRGAIGAVTASLGTCPQSGVASTWCTGGVFVEGASDGAFYSPYGLAIDSKDGFIFVADHSNSRVQKLNIDTGASLGAIGALTSSTGTCPASGVSSGWCKGGIFEKGAVPGSFYIPASLAVDSVRGYIYVADYANSRIQKFSISSGALIYTFGDGVDDGVDSRTFGPLGLAMDEVNNWIYVVDSLYWRVQKISIRIER